LHLGQGMGGKGHLEHHLIRDRRVRIMKKGHGGRGTSMLSKAIV